MRRTFVTTALLTMLVGLGIAIGLRWQNEPLFASDESETQNPEEQDAATPEESDGSVANTPDATADAAAEPPLDRPLRVVGERLALLTPGLLANGGQSSGSGGSFEEARLQVSFAETSRLSDLEAALAKGGAEDDGADIAILPLPQMVAAYERLRALSPRAFFVAGWSRGRDGIYLDPSATRSSEVRIIADGDSAASFTSFFYLLKSGTDPDSIRVAEDGDNRVPYAAVDHLTSSASRRQEDRRPVMTTADATELVPYVAIAPEGFVREHPDVLIHFVTSFVAGMALLQADVPAGARTVAQTEDAPEAVTLVRQLGRVEFAGLVENVRVFGLSGRDAVTLQRLFQESWNAWRDTGALSTPAPEAAPLQDAIISAVVRNQGFPDTPPQTIEPDFDAEVLLTFVAAQNDDAAVHEIGLLAGVFRRSAIRVFARGRNGSERLIERVTDRYGLPTERFVPLRRAAGGAVVVQVLATP